MQSSQGRRRWLVIVGVLALLFLVASSSRFYTDILWFREVGFESVLWTSLRVQYAVGVAVGLVVALVVWANLVLAARIAPTYRFTRLEAVAEDDPLERLRESVEPYLRWLRLAVAVAIGLLAGLGASAAWRMVLLYLNRVDFGTRDPQFDRDIAFYVFELPFLNQVLSWAWFALLASLLVSLGAHYFQGSIRPEAGLRGVQSGALAHLSVLLGLLALVKAARYWLGKYSLAFSERGVVTGAGYTDVNAHLPALQLLAIISVISAILFLVNIRFRRVSLPLAAVGIWVLTSIVAGALWPLAVQNFSVDPQEFPREERFIARNIEATQAAYDLTDVQEQPFAATPDLTSDEIESNQSVFANVRVWDPGVLEQAFAQLQALRTYYEFDDVDIDRYEVDGEMRQVLLSARELSLENLADRSWSNEHLQFTHGYGVVASLANEATVSGQPSFLVRDVPGTVSPEAESLSIDEPRLYFGESFDSFEYSVVDTEQSELDYTDENGDVQRSRYEGEGGVPFGNLFTRLAFAVRERDPNLVLSNLITDRSQILIYRNVRDRVLRAAPFLSLDNDPYPAVVEGRLVWIIDAYTSTEFYPYSQRVELDPLIEQQPGALSGRVNYVRNSVKVVVDAYDGSMSFHVVDEQDPLIRAWRGAFPALFTDEEPSEELRAHFRYPEDLFSVQSEVFLTYHMDDPANFYAKEDAWAVPQVIAPSDGLVESTSPQGPVPPTYLLFSFPGQVEQEFVLTRPFTPRTRNNMVALMAARSDPDNYGELVTLEFPSQRTVLGPSQIGNLINQDVEISRAISLLDVEGSQVIFGSLVVLPVEDSILYVQPLFIQAEDEGIPELKKVILVSGETVVMENTFEEALASLFGVSAQPPPDDEPPPDGDQPGGGPPAAGGRLAELVERASRLYDRAQQVLAEGDFETYGRLIERVGELLARAQRLSE